VTSSSADKHPDKPFDFPENGGSNRKKSLSDVEGVATISERRPSLKKFKMDEASSTVDDHDVQNDVRNDVQNDVRNDVRNDQNDLQNKSRNDGSAEIETESQSTIDLIDLTMQSDDEWSTPMNSQNL
jgi:hypothetical protein